MLLSMAKVISATDECADWDLRLHVTKSSLAHGIAIIEMQSGHSCLGNCAWSWNYTDCQNNGECYLFCLLVFFWRPKIWDCLCQNNVSCGRFLVFFGFQPRMTHFDRCHLSDRVCGGFHIPNGWVWVLKHHGELGTSLQIRTRIIFLEFCIYL